MKLTLYLPLTRDLADPETEVLEVFKHFPAGEAVKIARLDLEIPDEITVAVKAKEITKEEAEEEAEEEKKKRPKRVVLETARPFTVLRDTHGRYFFSLDDPGAGMTLGNLSTLASLAAEIWKMESDRLVEEANRKPGGAAPPP